MALLFIDSFDHYQTPHVLSKWTRQFTDTEIMLGQGRCDSSCLRLNGTDTLLKGLLFGSTRGTIGFAANFSRFSLAETVFGFATVGDAAASHMVLLQNPDGSLQVVRYTGTVGASLGLSAPNLINEDHWYFIEWEFLIHPSAGEVIVRLNNTVVISAAGVNTVGVGCATLLRQIGFHCGQNSEWRMDDLYVLDSTGPAPANTFLGDVKVEYLRPNAPGALQQWSIFGSEIIHWEAVDDNQAPDDDVSYIHSVTPGQTDVQHYQATGLPSGSIFGAQLSLYAKKSDSGPRVIAPVVAGVVGPSITNVSSDNYQYHHTPYALNPATGLAWTIDEINTLQAGVTIVS